MPRLTSENTFLKSLQLKQEQVPSFDTFPFDLPVIRHLGVLDFHPNVTYIIGENGMGKSTLLEAIAVELGFNPEGGTRNFNFSSYDSHSPLDNYIRISKGVQRPIDHFFFRAESFYNVATNIEVMDSQPMAGPRIIDSFGGKSLHEQSHGEAFFATFIHRFQGNGLYILDEPEAALSPLRQMSMLTRIHELVENGSQFIISTHSPILMAYPQSLLFELSDSGIRETTLEETSHYAMMRQFFENKDRMLHHLFYE
ncbi:MAG: AAA family ATPase [Bacillota bacterium]|uniref:AAA family ATPase n=1 Tax=Virgibacillus salarius TaxID=447199 RepID=A0A941DZQ9_9BACI|nr:MULTISPECIES: AAA family ATPase [Bacillaceae]NAZ09837.1 AAA family ATPase [Agaribacter marinus]MBR7797128.1 AAA family ATPase [Virgibacillus salarius]MCC2252331.1 AAA family ATPase [Virgibacillus sp. AGTR]MDY7044889.1 AAA family ATPase [Virgibacillus sp. M23]QRZ18900.1 AAA family ATPase [Virgibacillus sp. AGTR]